MNSLRYAIEYAEEERADYTREQDEHYSVGDYDFDPSYEFDNGPKVYDQHEEKPNFHDDRYYDDMQDYYDLPFEPDDDYYSLQEEYDHFEGQVKYSLQDYLSISIEYRHDLNGYKNKQTEKRKQKLQNPKINEVLPTPIQANQLNKSSNPIYSQISKWYQSWGSLIFDKGMEIVGYPLNVTLETADKIISIIVDTGIATITYPLKFTFSKSLRLVQRTFEKSKNENSKKNIIELYYKRYSKSEIAVLLNINLEIVIETLNEFYNSISHNSPVLLCNSPDYTKETMKADKEEENSGPLEKQLEEPDNSPDQPINEAQDEDDESELIEKIIYLLNQNLTLAQIAGMLNLEINFLFYLTKLLKQYHMDKVEYKDELENAIPTVKSVLKQYSHIINDDVINKLPENIMLSMAYLRSKTKLSDQKLRNVYRTELLLQTNLLLLAGYDKKQVAELVGINVRNIHETIKTYQLPNLILGNHVLEFPINNKNLAQQYEIPEKRVYDFFKYELLCELNDRLIAGQDVKAIAKDTGIYYRTTLNWKNTYKLPNTISYEGFSEPLEKYDNSWPLVEPGKLKYDEGTHSRYLDLSPETRIMNNKSEIISLSRVEGLSPTELKEQGPFLMMNKKHELVMSDIYSIESVQVDHTYFIETEKDVGTLVGSSTTLTKDNKRGLIQGNVDIINDQDVLALRSLDKIASYLPTFFNLFEGTKEPLRMVMKEKTIEEIKTRLIIEFGSSKEGSKQLDINYKNFIEFRYLSHQNLIDLYNRYGYPNLRLINFMKNIEKIGIKGKKAKIDNPLMTTDLLYVMGLIGSDGYLLDQIKNRKSVTGFNNKIKKLIDFHVEFLDSIFPERHVAISNPRPPTQVTYEAVTYNYAFSRIINNFSVKGIDVDEREAFLKLLRLPINFITAFIEGFVDGDGNVEFRSQRISIGIFNPYRANNFVLLLKKLGINPTIIFSKQRTKPPRSNKYYISNKWDVVIAGKVDLIRFIDLIKPKHPEKKIEMKKLRKKLEKQISLTSKYRRAPIRCGQLLKPIRNKLNITQKELDYTVGMVNVTWQLENGKNRTSVKNISMMIEYFVKKGATEQLNKFKELKQLISDDYILIKPKIKKIQGSTKLFKIKIRNRLVTDNSLILDSLEI